MKRIKWLYEAIADWCAETTVDMTASVVADLHKGVPDDDIMARCVQWLRDCSTTQSISNDISLKDLARTVLNTARLRKHPEDGSYFRPTFTGRTEQVCYESHPKAIGEITDHGELWAAWGMVRRGCCPDKDMAVFVGYYETADAARNYLLSNWDEADCNSYDELYAYDQDGELKDEAVR